MLDIEKNRKSKAYSYSELALRVAWGVARYFFWFSPRICFSFRAWILRAFGAKIGRHVHVYPTAHIYFPWNLQIGDYSAIGDDCLIYNLGQITIGTRTTVSHRAHLCSGTHDHNDSSLPLIRTSITIGDDVWICTDAFIGPRVTISNGAIVGARAAVFRDVHELSIVGGNPAKVISHRELKTVVNSLDPIRNSKQI